MIQQLETGAVIPSVAVDAILAKRDAIVRAAEQVDAVLRNVPDGFPQLQFSNHQHQRWSVEIVRQDADRVAWDQILKGTGLWSFLDATARAEWHEILYSDGKKPVPVCNHESARDTMAGIHAARGAMTARGVADVFRRLSPDYRTNRADRFGDRMILRSIGSPWGPKASGWVSVNTRAADDLDDLSRMLHVLRGLPEPAEARSAYRILNAAITRPDSWPAVAQFPFFQVKVFKNGNGHLAFDFAEDVLRLNKVLSIATGGATITAGVRREKYRSW